MKIFLGISILLVFTHCKSDNQSHQDPSSKIHSNYSTQLPRIPKTVHFFGSEIVLNDMDIRERLDRELLVNIYFQSSTTLAIKRSHRYFPIIEKILKEEGVPDDFKYLCVIESNLTNVVSPAGAAGFWQFMPGTAPIYKLKISPEVDERYHLEKSTRAACKLIKSNFALFKDWINACAAYNRGPNGLAYDMESQGVKHFFDTEMNPETSRYVFRIMAIKLIMENPEKYGYIIPKKERYAPILSQAVRIKSPIKDLAIWAKKHNTTLKNLRILNPWILGTTLTKNAVPCELMHPSDNKQLGIYRP